jgi:hypothetical protein
MNLYGPIYSSKLKDVSGMTSIISEQYQLAEQLVLLLFSWRVKNWIYSGRENRTSGSAHQPNRGIYIHEAALTSYAGTGG